MLPELDKIEIPKVQAFIVTIYDRNNNSYFKRLNSSEARSHTFDSMSEEFQDAGLVGNERVINVTVVTDAGMFTNTSAAFSGIDSFVNCILNSVCTFYQTVNTVFPYY